MISGYIGMPRSGKTTYLARYIAKNYWKYKHIYICGDKLCEDYVSDPSSITYLHPYEIGSFEPIHNSLIVLCEAGTYFNNRLFATMPHYCLDFFATHGHYECDIIWDSQTANVDCQLLDKTNKLYIITKSLIPVFSHSVKVNHGISVNPDTGKLDERYTLPEGFFKKLFAVLTFRIMWMYRPRYYGIFDTHADIMFKGEGILERATVYKQVPLKYVKLLNYYNKRIDIYEKNKIKNKNNGSVL